MKLKTYENSDLTKETLYLNVPQTLQTTTAMSLDDPSQSLNIDVNGDGTTIQQMAPTSNLSGDAVTDFTPPVTSITQDGTQGTNGWYKSDITLTFNAQDSGAGILKTYYYKDGEQTSHEVTNPLAISTEGTTKLWYFSVDKAGNSEEPKEITLKLDKTNPNITYKDRTEANANGWNKTDVIVNWTCSDEISGVIDSEISKSLTTEGQDQSITGTCTDKAGNTADNMQTGIKIDKTEPSITISVPVNNSTYILKSSVNANWSTSDQLSGIGDQTGTVLSGNPIDTSTIGSHTFTVSASDLAGNNKTQSVTYKVIYRFDGFLQPVNDTGHEQLCGSPCIVSVFKGGSTVPVKFQLKDAAGNVVQSTNLPQWLSPQKGATITDNVDETVYTDPETSGNTYSWDNDQYHYNWGTKGVSTGYYWLIGVTLDDGQTYTVNLGLR